MADPLEVLAAPVEPVSPDPSFTADLRARLERALNLPRGVAVSNVTMDRSTARAEAGAPGPADFPRPGALPYLTIRGAREAIDWYADAFGAALVGDPYVMPDGRIGHAELEVGGGSLYLADEFADIGLTAPTEGATSVSLMLPVHDTDATLDRARSAGGRVEREPYEDHGTRNASLLDPFGHRWMLAGPLRDTAAAPDPIRHGDIGFVSMWTPDVERAARFYTAVLGWEYGPVEREEARHVTSSSMPQGLWGDQAISTLFCCFAVDDLASAVDAVRTAGGTAEEPTEAPYGPTAMCTDDAGTVFALYEPRPDNARPTPNGLRQGDLAYVTFHVTDSARHRDFFGAVLGWRFEPGRVEDGWGPIDVQPMTGVSGGHAREATLPMWLVDDITDAVRRVRDAGGTSSDVQQQPYGLMTECADDQGGRFYLGQL